MLCFFIYPWYLSKGRVFFRVRGDYGGKAGLNLHMTGIPVHTTTNQSQPWADDRWLC